MKYDKKYVPALESFVKESLSTDDIVPEAKFKIASGTVFIIDKVYADDIFGTAVETSMEGGKKGNYRNSMDDLLDFLNTEGAVKA